MNEIDLINGFILKKTKLDLAVVQGKTYQVSFNYPDDLTTGTLKGEIRTRYAQDNGELLGSFNFLPMSYNSVTNKTTITAQLQADVTEEIPYTKFQGVGEPTIRNCYVYDIEWRENSFVKQLSRGLVQVIPEVTI